MHHQYSIPRDLAQRKYNAARSNLLMMIGFTLLNIILFLAGSSTMFLFSATIPYFAVTLGVIFEFTPVLVVCSVIAAAALVLYLICWHFSKRHHGWLIAALVMFCLDCAFLLWLYLPSLDVSGILDILIHAWVLYYLIIGVKYGAQLKKMPEATPQVSPGETEHLPELTDSTPLHRADEDVRFRVLLESEQFGRHICYRRVKRLNQLVIDGYVYDEVEMLFEKSHELSAVKDGHIIAVGLDGQFSYLAIDGETVAKIRRLY